MKVPTYKQPSHNPHPFLGNSASDPIGMNYSKIFVPHPTGGVLLSRVPDLPANNLKYEQTNPIPDRRLKLATAYYPNLWTVICADFHALANPRPNPFPVARDRRFPVCSFSQASPRGIVRHADVMPAEERASSRRMLAVTSLSISRAGFRLFGRNDGGMNVGLSGAPS